MRVPTEREERGHAAAEIAPRRQSHGAVLALQRTAGNAVVTRLIQRQLDFTDDGTTFTDPAAAKSHLLGAYAKTHAQPVPADGQTRLTSLASTALGDRVIETTLAGAVKYVHDGTPLAYRQLERDPSKSPSRDDSDPWEYQMALDEPSVLDAPQSPRREFPETEYPAVKLQIPTELKQQKAALHDEHGRRVKAKEKLGNNQFKYKVVAQVRIEQFEKHDRGGTAFYSVRDDMEPEYTAPSQQSQQYSSQMSLLGPTPGDAQKPYEQPMRTELDLIANEGRKRPSFQKGSHIYGFERNKKGVDRRGDYFTNTERASTDAIGSLYFHSEVQAGAHAHESAGKQLAEGLIASISSRAREVRKASPAVRVVVVSVDLSGWSSPNTVCSGACKGALVHIGEVLDMQFKQARHAAKIELATEDVFLRGSKHLGVSGHVGSEQKFQGYTKGASTQTDKSKKRKHHTITEYKPEVMNPPKKEKKPKKEKEPPKKKHKKED
jgi:hypothetical protein